MKKLIAYSSISHIGFVTLGMYIAFAVFRNSESGRGAALGVEGAMVQMISHGFVSGALFLCVGVLYDRVHSRQIADYGGVIHTMPWFGAFLVYFAMANAGLPGTSGFVGEFMVILATFRADFWFAVLAATTLVLAAAFTLWMVKRVVYGDVKSDKVAKLQDLNGREAFNLGALAAVVLLFGLWPAPLVNVMQTTVENLVVQISACKLPAEEAGRCTLPRAEPVAALTP
jgi:NADH-quinone oxidoreductase subunit M